MIVVSGASGKLGRRTIERLIERTDPTGVRALSRTPDTVADLGVQTRFADFAEPDSLVPAFDGAQRLLLISIGGNRPEHARQQADAIAAAAKAGVGQVIYTSIPRAADPANTGMFVDYHRATERVLRESGLPFTILRFNMWPEILTLTGIVASALRTGVLPSNAGDGGVGYLTRDDSAAVAAAVLAEGGSVGQLVEVTGPSVVTDAELAEVLSSVGGRPVRHEPVSDTELAPALLAGGVPEVFANALVSTGARKREGWFDIATQAVQRLTGHRPTSVEEYLAARLS